MERMAIFVEGQTEQHFVTELIRAIADVQKTQVEWQKANGRRGNRFLTKTKREYKWPDSPSIQHYVLIVDCGNDESVVSDVVDGYEALAGKGYQRIIGLRDVWPSKLVDIAAIEGATRKAIHRIIGKPSIPVDVLLAVMEIEAWFIAEFSHFQRISKNITHELIGEKLGCEPEKKEIEAIGHPAKTLNEIYQLGGARYRKNKGVVARTVHCLDYDQVYLALPSRVPRLRKLIAHIDGFLSGTKRQ